MFQPVCLLTFSSVRSRLPVLSPFFGAPNRTGFPLDCHVNYFKCEIGPDGIFFSAADLCLIHLGSSQLCSFLVFNNLGLSQIVALYPTCVCVCATAVCSRSSLQLQIWRRPGHSSFAGQRPERQRLQPAG